MHELSVAQSIIEIIQQHISESEWECVRAVRLKIGVCAGIVPDSLEFSFQAITAESSLRQAKLEIETIPFRIYCNTCKTTTEDNSGFVVCGICGSADTKIISGLEMQINEIEITESELEKL